MSTLQVESKRQKCQHYEKSPSDKNVNITSRVQATKMSTLRVESKQQKYQHYE